MTDGIIEAPAAVPDSAQAARDRLIATPVPDEIVDVCRRLGEAGHHAVLVGGAVRDALLARPGSDWDVASAATPDEVTALFRRTIPTGVEHGTVTVLVRTSDGETHPVEITTFRGEGEYADGRRPDSVEFHRDLVEDLARRDLTFNALAWDPVAQVLTDPFGGLDDLREGVVRAVGEPLRRFTEDGLRTMRAVRFCATLALRLDDETAAAIPGALDVLDKVSRERVHVELTKLLSARRPSMGLRPMADTGIWARVLPLPPSQALAAAITDVDDMRPDPVPRLARLLRDVEDGKGALAAVDALRPSRAERKRIEAYLSFDAWRLRDPELDPATLRGVVASLGRDHLEATMDVMGLPGPRRTHVRALIVGVPMTTGELAIAGRDVIAAGLVDKGRAVGELLRRLLSEVHRDPRLNDHDTLLQRARELTG